MRTGKLAGLLALLTLSGISIQAEDAPIRVTAQSSPVGELSLEASLTFPIAVQIYLAQAAYRASQSDELLGGFCFQNWKDQGDVKGRAHAYTLVLGYRRYLWKDLHLELELFPAWNSFDSSTDGKTYNGWEMWIEYRIGWKLRFAPGGLPCYLLLQPGLGHALYLQKVWPGLDPKTYRRDSLMFIPQISFGVTL